MENGQISIAKIDKIKITSWIRVELSVTNIQGLAEEILQEFHYELTNGLLHTSVLVIPY